jgi:hypothetical protein
LSLKEEKILKRSSESQMDIDSKTIPSSPSTVQREKDIIPVDPVAPVDMFRDIAVGHKGLPKLTLQEAEKHTSLSRHIPRKQMEIF